MTSCVILTIQLLFIALFRYNVIVGEGTEERFHTEGASIMSIEERVPNERLRHARSLKGWSQAKLAEEVGTSFEMVSRWERGVTTPTLYFRGKISQVLGMTAEELG